MAEAPKTYSAPWKGELILACRKCQKKLVRDQTLKELAKFKKTVKRYNAAHPDHQLHVMNVACMDLCPKNGVTVCCPERESLRLLVMRREADLVLLTELR